MSAALWRKVLGLEESEIKDEVRVNESEEVTYRERYIDLLKQTVEELKIELAQRDERIRELESKRVLVQNQSIPPEALKNPVRKQVSWKNVAERTEAALRAKKATNEKLTN